AGGSANLGGGRCPAPLDQLRTHRGPHRAHGAVRPRLRREPLSGRLTRPSPAPPFAARGATVLPDKPESRAARVSPLEVYIATLWAALPYGVVRDLLNTLG